MTTRKIALSTFMMCLIAHPAMATLPPLYQSIREISALISNPAVTELFTSARTITSIVRSDDGDATVYIVSGSGCSVSVRKQVLADASRRPGPQSFQFIVGTLQCAPSPSHH
jgi:hypothetical protein